MLALTLILVIACAAALGWGFWLYQQLVALKRLPPPSSDPFPAAVRSLAAALDAGLLVVDHDCQVRYLNDQAQQLLGLRDSEPIGQGLIGLIRDYQVDALTREVLHDGEAREMVFQPFVGGRMLRVRVAPLVADDIGDAILLIRDVTQINMLERARRDMVVNVSHELRTPLASIKLLVETLQSSPPPAVAQRMLVQMAQEVDAVTQLVDELHELSQIEAGRVVLQLVPTALAPVVARALERIRPQAERKALHISAYVADTLPPVLIDADRIGQVLLNLLHNGVKFTPAGGSITARACVITIGPGDQQIGYVERRTEMDLTSSIEQDRRHMTRPLSQQGRPTVEMPQPLTPGDWMLIIVTDTGVGIPARDLPRIFERFYKVDRSRTRHAGGTGLGLAIAKHLIEGHGGRIWASSEEGAGSTFYFALPLAS